MSPSVYVDVFTLQTAGGVDVGCRHGGVLASGTLQFDTHNHLTNHCSEQVFYPLPSRNEQHTTLKGRALLEKLIVSQLGRISSHLMQPKRFITVLTTACYMSVPESGHTL